MEFSSGDPDLAISRFEDEDTTGSQFLSDVEVGTVAAAVGDWGRALEKYLGAAEFTKDQDRAAVVSPETLGETLIEWTITERVGPYRPEGYERVMLHASLAMAYLSVGLLEDARVEVRLADRILTGDEKLYDAEYAAGGLGHLVSAVSYELAGQFDQAIIDYRRMVEKRVGLDVAGPALVRLYRVMGRFDEAARWEARFGPPPEIPDGAASVVMIAGVGIGPVKREIRLDLPTGDGVLSWAVPEYVGRPQPVPHLLLSCSGLSGPAATSVIEDVTHTAIENLSDRILWLTAKATVRAFLKRELTQAMYEEWGGLGAVIGTLFSILTERADLRCWRTLPDTWQAVRVFVPSGRTRLGVSAVGGDAHDLGFYELLPGETVFVFARSAGTRLFTNVVGGRPLENISERNSPAAVESTDPKGATR